MVEADSTYYGPPSRQLAEGWAERTPDGFRMNVKAYSMMTGHPTKPETLWRDIAEALEPEAATKRNVYPHHLPADAVDEVWTRFADALEPLRASGRLGSVLLQYPPWFTPKAPTVTSWRGARAAGWPARMRGAAVAAVVRQGRPRPDAGVAGGPRADAGGRGCPHGQQAAAPGGGDDGPGGGAVPRPGRRHLVGTGDVRGRALPLPLRQAGAASVGQACRSWPAKPREVHVLMNNCYEDYGVRNAADMTDLLGSIVD